MVTNFKTCPVCGLSMGASHFRDDGRLCVGCYYKEVRATRDNDPEWIAYQKKLANDRNKKSRESAKAKKQRAAYNHAYYLEHKEESRESVRKCRAKKKLQTPGDAE